MVSPRYPAFPMSVDGQPYQWPGRPQDQQMGGDPTGGGLFPGGGAADGDGDGDGDGNPFADSGDDGDDGGDEADPAEDGDEPDDTEAEVGGRKQPPFGKKKAASLMFRTASGALLPEHEYLRHLAVASAYDPDTMAARIKAERRRSA